jgi:hypothetical protein
MGDIGPRLGVGYGGAVGDEENRGYVPYFNAESGGWYWSHSPIIN